MSDPTWIELGSVTMTVDRLIRTVFNVLCNDDSIPADQFCERHAEQLEQAAAAVRYKLAAADHPCPACMGEGDGVDGSGCSRCGNTGKVSNA